MKLKGIVLFGNTVFVAQCFLGAIFLLCSFAVSFGLVASRLEVATAKKVLFWTRQAMIVAAALAVVVLVLLTIAFLTDDFSIAIVGQYSSTKLPFFYKLSAVWAGSAGSLLLWSVGVFVLFALWLARSETNRPTFNAAALSIGSGICLAFSALLIFVAKPFATSPVTLDDGMGLNPLLQNFWMIIHPPLLFVGYSAFLIPFAIVLACVFAGRIEDSDIYKQLRRWMLFGICFLSLGILTGARWSYIELGWGGYWAWDPVENASLLPWLSAVAALHCLVGMRFSGKFRFWAVVLMPVPFILCLVATFVTRSGILSSLHSFDQNAMFSALLIFITCCVLLWVACIIRAARSISVGVPQIGAPILDRAGLLSWANLILICVAVIIAVATFWPVIWRVATNSTSGIEVTRAFYDTVISAAGAILAFLVGLVALAEFQKPNRLMLEALGCSAAGLICFGLVLGQFDVVMAIVCGICAFSFVSIFIKLCISLKKRGRIGGHIAHFGLLLLVATVGFSSIEQSNPAQLSKGEKLMLGRNHEFTYERFVHKQVDGIVKFGPEIVVRKGNLQEKLWPHNSEYPDRRSTAEVAVYTGLLEDIYVSLDSISPDGSVGITVKIKPLMLWLWIATLLIVAGIALAMLEVRRRKR